MQYIHRKVTVGINISVLRQSLRAASTRLETASPELRKTLGPSPSTSVWERQWLFLSFQKEEWSSDTSDSLPPLRSSFNGVTCTSKLSKPWGKSRLIPNQSRTRFPTTDGSFSEFKSDSFRHVRMHFYDWNRPDRPNLVIEGSLISELSNNRFLLYLLMWRFDSSVGK